MSPLSVGSEVEFNSPVKAGRAKLVAIIGAWSTPHPGDISKWYGDDASKSAYRAIVTSRYVFQRVDRDSYVIIPERLLSELMTIVVEVKEG